MKVLIFSDIHGDIDTLQKMIEVFENGKFNLMIITGDFINHGPRNGLPAHFDQKQCVELLNRYKDKIIAVRGNCDSEVDQMLLEFPIMCDYTQLFFDSMRIFVHHGHKSEYSAENLKKLLPKSSDKSRTIIISGHTHIPVNEEKDGFTFLNPGSITFPKGGSQKSYAIIDTENGEIKLCELL
ncbi:MAG: phosphodiesterase [Treponemataceae bacterium]|nr:phosphodiesterase [Treponemataceae bacterium]